MGSQKKRRRWRNPHPTVDVIIEIKDHGRIIRDYIAAEKGRSR